MGEFFSGNNERWESHERRGHMWGDVVPQEQSVLKPEMVMRSIIPVVMASVLGIYGLIVAVIIQGSSK